MIKNTKIIIADDMEPILLYLEKVVSTVPEFEVVGKAKNGKELIDLVKQYNPDLVITDEEMPECTGLQAIEELNGLGIKTKYILVTSNDNYIITSKARCVGILKVIKKPMLDDNKFISQIKEVLALNNKDFQKETNRNNNVKLENKCLKKKSAVKKIIEKLFKSK